MTCPYCGSSLRHYNGEQDMGNGTNAPMYTCLADKVGSARLRAACGEKGDTCDHTYIDEAAARPVPEAS